MKITDKRIVKALEQWQRIGREALYGTIYSYKSDCCTLVIRQARGQKKLYCISVADLKADDWEVID